MFFHTLAWFFYDLFDFGEIWYVFAIVTAILFLLAILAGLLAMRLFKKGAPPTPDMAIEEAKLVRADFEAQAVQRDQLERSKT